MRTLYALPAVLLLAAAPGAARDKDPIPEARPIGRPVSCIQLNQIRNQRIRSDSVIDFEMTGRRVYRNTLPMACPRLASEERFLHKTSTNQLCSTDIITVLQSPGLSQGPSCGLGEFQPVELVKPARR